MAHDDLPEELLVCSAASIPLIREALKDTRHLNRVWPDLANGELCPVRHLEMFWTFPLVHQDLLLLEQLLEKLEGAIIQGRKDDELEEQRKMRKSERLLTVLSLR